MRAGRDGVRGEAQKEREREGRGGPGESREQVRGQGGVIFGVDR